MCFFDGNSMTSGCQKDCQEKQTRQSKVCQGTTDVNLSFFLYEMCHSITATFSL